MWGTRHHPEVSENNSKIEEFDNKNAKTDITDSLEIKRWTALPTIFSH